MENQEFTFNLKKLMFNFFKFNFIIENLSKLLFFC